MGSKLVGRFLPRAPRLKPLLKGIGCDIFVLEEEGLLSPRISKGGVVFLEEEQLVESTVQPLNRLVVLDPHFIFEFLFNSLCCLFGRSEDYLSLLRKGVDLGTDLVSRKELNEPVFGFLLINDCREHSVFLPEVSELVIGVEPDRPVPQSDSSREDDEVEGVLLDPLSVVGGHDYALVELLCRLFKKTCQEFLLSGREIGKWLIKKEEVWVV